MLLFLDGMAHYDTARLAAKYSTADTTYCTYAITAEGRTGNCVKRTSTSNQGQCGYLAVAPLMTRLGVWSPTKSGVCGFAVKIDDLNKVNATPSGPAGDRGFFVVMEGAGAHLSVALNPDGTFTLWRTNFGYSLCAQSTEGLQSAAWAYVEFKWRIDDTTGSFEIRVGGTTVLTYSGKTTTNLTNLGVWNAVRLLGQVSTPAAPMLTLRMCDLYLADLATAAAADVSDFLGDGTINCIVPNNVGSTTGWSPSGGANWQMVDDRPSPDDDGTYNAASFLNTKDTYAYEDIPPAATVKGVQVCILARKETEGTAAVAPIVHQGSTDYVGPTQGVATLAYDRYLTQPYDLNPATTAKFTAGEINAGEFGVVKVS